MAATPPLNEPDFIVAGSTTKWRRYISDYLPATWTLSYEIVNSAAAISLTGTDYGDDTHLITVTAAASASYSSGEYYWQAFVTSGSERYDAGQGIIEVKANFASGAVDARSHVKTTLDALEATIEGKASKDQLSYTIRGRSLARMSAEEIIQWYSHYQRLWTQEKARFREGRDLASKHRIVTRMKG